MLLGNDILTRGIALFRRDFRSAFRRALLVQSSTPWGLAEIASMFLSEARAYLQATQTGQHRSFDAHTPREDVKLFSVLYFYLTVESFLLNPLLSESAPEEQRTISALEQRLKNIILPYFFDIIRVMRLNYPNLNCLTRDNTEHHVAGNAVPRPLSATARLRRALRISHRPSLVVPQPTISSESYESLTMWVDRFIDFRRDPRVMAVNYNELRASYRADIGYSQSRATIQDFLQNGYQDFQSFYLALITVINLFDPNLITPIKASDQPIFLSLLMDLYHDMIATAIFAEQAEYATALTIGTKIYVNETSFYYQVPYHLNSSLADAIPPAVNVNGWTAAVAASPVS
ncbi:MAG: hypothetical protein K5Q00_01105, partial [Gammaproteobacteria bacterium]|nr:hypothetical protein [Gammaproteobacteria bacterium]